mmetsp:Transcript_9458/g.12860  ORF Transcript_9458/g.12860 Transcript_9458/m.12860 type:complete len:87 (-) Transcript_9458:941-1201(-)
MTFIFIFKTFFANPGYLPEWLKTPLINGRDHPTNLIRVYNMRFWRANQIYSFEEFIAPDDDENIEIDLKLEVADNSSTTTEPLITS